MRQLPLRLKIALGVLVAQAVALVGFPSWLGAPSHRVFLWVCATVVVTLSCSALLIGARPPGWLLYAWGYARSWWAQRRNRVEYRPVTSHDIPAREYPTETLTFRNARLVALDPEGKPTGPAWDLGSGNIGLAAPDEMTSQPVEYLRPWGRERLTPQAVHGPWIPARDILPPGECAIHGPEDIPPNPYQVCGECGHAYATVQDLVDEHNRLLQQMAAMPQPPTLPMPEFTAEEVEAFKAELERAAQAAGHAYVPPAILAAITEPPKPWEPVEYRPLTYDQVDLVTCCPFCTHDW